MKQAILITAYKNYFHLEKIISFFDDDFQIYIHLDKKSIISDSELQQLLAYPNVQSLCQIYKVNWGGINHLKSILHLLKLASEDSENYYFHLISGHDFPIKKPEEFKRFFLEKIHLNYIENFKVPFRGWANNGGLDRLEYYNLFDVFNYKDNRQIRWINKALVYQKRLNVKRNFPAWFPPVYGGSTWWSLNKNAAEYIKQFQNQHPGYLKRFRHTLCSEEFYFQTILMNSPLKNTIRNNNLRYIDWKPRNGNNPAILDLTDLAKLQNSDAFFARKFELPISKELLTQLNA
ncbi:beta-1,6-N-acetylglucosaminyltransferase [Christiangramia sp. OXR-203]|uniref:beta-1,6-N-acetylglucosaminyltransferase n=1 Tax=Christiangramia sp. OXR-203 TaxID=3100176 RepID=UPI002AC91A8F|nr:beta-1,6-N-acetylglucosaminyltransferase [Christiangramia sp. OXR-203]WPY97909.1 beta-1,6-N-acetylglucosaminyltransferase [Christiangramia sp. OXR-203]